MPISDPLVGAVVFAAAALILLIVVARVWRSWREARAVRRRRAELQKTYGAMQAKQEEIERLAARIIATSSTSAIAGFSVIRQIEAVFTDGQPSPARAVDALKAIAAAKGANAVINLAGTRLASGKCIAQGDAVVVRPADESAPPTGAAR